MIQQVPHGVITHDQSSGRKTDYLYRVSMKCLVRNENDEVLVVKETGRNYWDLPGGGMDHGESIRLAIAREMKEEVNLEGEFDYRVIAVEEPRMLVHINVWQLRLIFEVKPSCMVFNIGSDGDEVAFMNPELFKNSASKHEQCVYDYFTVTAQT